MRKLTAVFPLLLLGLCSAGRTGAQPAALMADSLHAHLHHLAVTIGPRPMGSANERSALLWVVQRFAAWGADTAYVMPVPFSERVNTSSGVAVGVFRGRSDSLIVVGSHIDSDTRENPGANDNASGTAVMLELARVWRHAGRRYTLLFAAFGGEEGNLAGSRWFVDHFPEIHRVALMLQIDMAGSDGPLLPFIDTRDHQTPAWLVKDAFAIDRSLGYNSLKYPTQFFTLNQVLGGASSDHEPFLRRGIPAIDFTAGVGTSPIHTPNDRIEFISRAALERSARLVDGLLHKYQTQGIPGSRTGNYMLWQLSGGVLFVPTWAIAAVDVLALLLGVAAFTHGRARRLQSDTVPRGYFSGAKVFLLLFVIAIFTQLGEAAMQLLKGLRYPWFVHIDEYLTFAALFALAGFWLALWLSRNWRFSPDPYFYLKRGLLPLWLLVILAWLVSPRLALYPALTLLCFSLAVLLPGTLLKLLCALAAPLPMFALMFFELFAFGARAMPRLLAQAHGFTPSLIYSTVLTLLLVIWYLPSCCLFAYTFAHGYRHLSWLRLLRRPLVGLLLLLAVFAYGGYLYAFPAYNERWRALLRVTARYDQNTQDSRLRLLGDEYFRGVTVKAGELSLNYDEAIHHADLAVPFRADWLSAAGSQTRDARDSTLVRVDWQLTSARPWNEVRMQVQSDTLMLSVRDTPLKYSKSRRDGAESFLFRWYADPDDTLRVQASFQLAPGSRLIRQVTALYVEPPLPLTVTAKHADVIYRTEVIRRDTLTAVPPADAGG
ncbi:MAG: M28 family metallopeptidase [candidate division KSB1 bacterium]|nr:M28 family metallopeptidase [candidate division KSB1 bacterium]MDZ7275642.1 M28 family metallopeptidase [candidate division KSB1 bacterium]MDZ7284667.1 M28 family metallopeptidase [candidate division KSB1 bacterium]MDZ7297914.1 M28 family metallopeptidase [candidate division KSB1 bacterium]MDZ7307121.1 M28 family metallopeptidase [candidate division KSB1 bacterium]